MKREKLRFTDEQIAAADSVNLITYAANMEYPIKQVTPRLFKISGYGGLYIHSDGNKWNWFSKNIGGGAIQFVMEMEGKTWVQAVKQLLGLSTEITYQVPQRVIEKEELKGKFTLPEKNNTYTHIIAYNFIKEDKLYENKYASCVFVGFDKEKEPKYASVRSTNTVGKSLRADVKNSDKTYPFCKEGTSDTLCVFEAPIDLMSYLTLIKIHNIQNFRNHCISLGGVADKALDYYLKENKNITKIMLCLDNDEAWHFSCQQIREKYHENYKIQRHSPKGKDFNEDLIRARKESHMKVSEAQYEGYAARSVVDAEAESDPELGI